jgi:ATP-dependent Lon protease
VPQSDQGNSGEEKQKVAITSKNLGKYAGVAASALARLKKITASALSTALAYTEFGGDLLSIEAVTMPGKDGKVSTTGT